MMSALTALDKANANHQFFDRYSISHAATGVVFEASRIPVWVAIGSHIVWELVENRIKLKVKHIWPDNRPDAWENSVGDVISFTAGYYGSRLLKDKPGGNEVLSAFVAGAAMIWTWNLLKGHAWGT